MVMFLLHQDCDRIRMAVKQINLSAIMKQTKNLNGYLLLLLRLNLIIH